MHACMSVFACGCVGRYVCMCTRTHMHVCRRTRKHGAGVRRCVLCFSACACLHMWLPVRRDYPESATVIRLATTTRTLLVWTIWE